MKKYLKLKDKCKPGVWMDLHKESGATLVETLVAMAILVSVLLPTVLFLGFVSHSPHNRDKIQAIGLAQTMMEKTLDQKNFVNKNELIERRWMIRQEVQRQNELVSIKVSVFRVPDTLAITSFYTERLIDQPVTLSDRKSHNSLLDHLKDTDE